MRVRRLHGFDLTPAEMVAWQRRLAPRIVRRGAPPRRLRLLAGVDCSPSPDGRLHAAAVLCAAPDWHVVAASIVARRPALPYVPGLLSFRELPAVLDAVAGLAPGADAVLVDGQGVAHPRRLGIASHLGLALDVPVVGVAKSRLVGTHEAPGPERGDAVALMDGGERIGLVVRTRRGVKPVYVSVGHRIALRSALRVVLAAGGGYRLPEPVRHADHVSRAAARAGP